MNKLEKEILIKKEQLFYINISLTDEELQYLKEKLNCHSIEDIAKYIALRRFNNWKNDANIKSGSYLINPETLPKYTYE